MRRSHRCGNIFAKKWRRTCFEHRCPEGVCPMRSYERYSPHHRRRGRAAFRRGRSIFDAARMNGIPIPTLCHQQNETPVGVCRVCLVEAGGRVLTASCVRPAENGMKVSTNRPRWCRLGGRGRAADGGPSQPRARGSGKPGIASWRPSPRTKASRESRFAHRLSPRGQDDSSLRDRGGSRSVHSVRPLHSRMR